MSGAPDRMWREQIAPSKMYPDGGAFYHEAPTQRVTVEYIRADLGSFYQEKDIDALEARIAELSRAGNTLAVYAVTTGGIAGRDEGLQQAIDEWCAVLRKDRDGEG